jgi:hypothetical protein
MLLTTCLATGVLVSAADKAPDPKTMSAPKRVVIPKLRGTINVDGDLREEVWAKAARLNPFFKNDGSGRERENTEVRLWYDDTALYLAWTCRDADIQATFTERDSKFWEEEVVEFFITGPGGYPTLGSTNQSSRYYELQWNPLRGVFDAIIENDIDERGVSKKFTGDWNYTAKGMKSAVKVVGTVSNSADKDEFWQVEVIVPFADLGQPAPKAKHVWRANFYRFNREKNQPAELLSWSPTLTRSFHEPGRFGFIEFGE